MKRLISLLTLALTVAASGAYAYDCNLSTVRCVGAGQEYNTSNETYFETALQSAIDAAQPGDFVVLTDASYQHLEASPNRTMITANVSGTNGNPITITSQDGVRAHIQGWGYPLDGSEPSRSDQVIFDVNGDYIYMENIEISASTGAAIVWSGSFGRVQNMYIHDCWGGGIAIGDDNVLVDGNLVQYNEVARILHSTAIIFSRRSSHTELNQNNIVQFNLTHSNGYDINGDKALPVTGDVAGGGNSDGISAAKDCNDRRLEATGGAVDNMCPGSIVRYNVAWDNADDCYDFSFGDGSVVMGNLGWNCGPEGNKAFKGLRNVLGGLTYVGNTGVGNFGRGFEPRFDTEGAILNNTVFDSLAHGIIPNWNTPTTVNITNNLAYRNGSADCLCSGTGVSNNWTEDENGLPALINRPFTYTDVNTGAEGTDVQTRVDSIIAQFRAALTPSPGSPLIDAGVYTAGVHCPTADDDPSNPHDPNDLSCWHWIGSAPDIGAFEVGIEGTGEVPSTARLKVPTNVTLTPAN